MPLLNNSSVLFILLALYLSISLPIFTKIYEATKVVIDEMFHIPQAQAYCEGRYHVWDPKITTLPGLYIAAQLINLVVPCNTYYLRMFNLTASAVNLCLFYVILNIVYGSSGKVNIAQQALNLAILPPLYFFSHVFYTDTVSLLFLLMFTISVMKRSNYLISILGIASIVMRQTNVIWVFMLWLRKFLEVVLKRSREYGGKVDNGWRLKGQDTKNIYGSHDIFMALYYMFRNPWMYFKSVLKHGIMDPMCGIHIAIPLVLFCLFVYLNGSIVVGDKLAHTATLNVPQLFYFLLFYGFFGLPFVLSRMRSTLSLMISNKIITVLLTLAVFAAVHYNTIVHPYLLADNRHYTFYIWNRWFGKYPEAVYVTVPLYVFLAFSFMDSLIHRNCISFMVSYITCLIPGLCFQRLLELRYFIIPYVIARMRFPRPSTWLVTCESIWYLVINVAFFQVFFGKEVMWRDFEEPQRIIW